jgi:glycerol-1-phosphatase
MPLSALLARYDQVILDLDGCVWVGDQATPRAPAAIDAIRGAGLGVAFVTNDGKYSPEDYVRRLWSLGCKAAVEEVISVGAALQWVLADIPAGEGAFVIGTDAVVRHVADAGHRILNRTPRAEEADVVVIVGYPGLHYEELRTATRALLGGARMIAGCRDATYPTSGGPSPGTGAIVAALEYATGRTAQTVGKPDPQMFRAALDRLGEGRTLVIGDRLDADLAGAAGVGLDGAIVLSGVTTREQAEMAADPAPIAIAPDLGSLVLTD